MVIRMMITRFQNRERQEFSSLWEALNLQEEVHKVISFTGAGGKTSLMFHLAEEAASKNFRVIVTTSTKIYQPREYPVILAKQAKEVQGFSQRGSILVVGQRFSQEKLMGILPEEIGQLKRYCDILLIEADGSGRMPLKIPREWEPVIIPETEVVVGCAGLDSIGQKFCEGCFGYNRVGIVLDKSEGDRIGSTEVAKIISSIQGTRKGVNNVLYRPVLTKADLVSGIVARETALLVDGCMEEPCVVVSFYERRS